MFITLGLLTNIPKQRFDRPLLHRDYPYINKLVENCAKKLDVDKFVRVIPVEGNNVSVFDNKTEVVIAIGLFSLLMFTESELEAAIYHELAHVYNKDTTLFFDFIQLNP